MKLLQSDGKCYRNEICPVCCEEPLTNEQLNQDTWRYDSVEHYRVDGVQLCDDSSRALLIPQSVIRAIGGKMAEHEKHGVHKKAPERDCWGQNRKNI